MVPPRIGIILAAACSALACGERPDPPGRAENGAGSNGRVPVGAGSASDGLDRPDDDGEVSDDVLEPPASPAGEPGEQQVAFDGGIAPPGDDEGNGGEPAPGEVAAQACARDAGNCFVVQIALSDPEADSCILLALDNCDGAARAGLQVALPVSWRFGAASVNRSADDCAPDRRFNPQTSTAIIDASGSITWNTTTRLPSEVVMDLTLQPLGDADAISVTNSDLVEQLAECN